MKNWHLLNTVVALIVLAASGCGGRANRVGSDQASPTTDRSRSAELSSSLADLSGAAAQPAVAHPWFVEVADAAGITFKHDSGTSPEKPFPAANGSGLAALDYDLDGRYDLYFATGTHFPLPPADRTNLSEANAPSAISPSADSPSAIPPSADSPSADSPPPSNALFRNLGGWRFRDVGTLCRLNHGGYTAGVTVGDFDNDGFPDVYLSCFGPNVLFRNQGDGTFQRLADAGVADSRWATSAAMLDYDNDGLLDLYVCNYAKWTWETNQFCGDRARNIRIFCSPHSVEAEQDILYRNRGDGTFEERTAAAGITDPAGRAQGVVVADLDDDGWMDIYVGNDLHANRLLLNQRDGTFRDASESSGTAYDYEGNRQAGMGVAAGDTNGDGRLDLLVTNFQDEHNALYENLGQGLFTEVADPRGLAAESRPWVGWGTALADFDLDGWLDAIVCNGHVDDNRQLLGQAAPYAAPALVWRNQQGRFHFLGRQAGTYFEQPHVGRGLVVADLDDDGDQDVVIGHQDAGPALLRNQCLSPTARSQPARSQPARSTTGPSTTSPPDADAGRRSLSLRLVGTRGNRDAVGATLTLRAGTRQAVRQISQGGSYLSAHDRRQVFAVLPGEDDLQLDIRWPGGGKNTLDGLLPGRHYVIREPRNATSPVLISPWIPHHE